jgi:hypothetical protein
MTYLKGNSPGLFKILQVIEYGLPSETKNCDLTLSALLPAGTILVGLLTKRPENRHSDFNCCGRGVGGEGEGVTKMGALGVSKGRGAGVGGTMALGRGVLEGVNAGDGEDIAPFLIISRRDGLKAVTTTPRKAITATEILTQGFPSPDPLSAIIISC